MTSAPTKSSYDLHQAEDGLIKMYSALTASGGDTSQVEAVYTVLEKEMGARSLFTKGLPKKKMSAKAAPAKSDADGKPDLDAAADASGVDDHDADDADNADDKAKKKAGADSKPPWLAKSAYAARLIGTGSVMFPPINRPHTDYVSKFIDADDSFASAAEVVHQFRKELLASGDVDPDFAPVQKADFTAEQRKTMAASGVAMASGAFPIPDEASLHNAIRLVGHADDPHAAMAHIIERAKAMGMTAALPPAWNVPDAGTESTPEAPKPGAHALAPDAGKGGAGKGSAASTAGSSGKTSTPSTAAKSFEYTVVEKSAERQFTMGPVYMPNQLDAHSEWTTAAELQSAAWDYVRKTGGDRNVYLQHSDKPAGEWVEIMQWPHPVSATMQKSIDGVVKSVPTTFPAGTVYLGVVWKNWAWEDVKNELITGFSMGGWARRTEAQIDAV